MASSQRVPLVLGHKI